MLILFYVGYEIVFIIQKMRVIGQKVLIKIAACIEKSMVAAILNCFKQDIGWTKSVDKKSEKY